MVALVLGLLKGAIIGGGIGFGAYQLGFHGTWGYVVYAVVGLLVGLLAGRPFWSHLADPQGTIWTSVLKGLVGGGVGAGLFFVIRNLAGDPVLTAFGNARPITEWTHVFGAAVGMLYGVWVELDDPIPKKKSKA